MLHEMPSPAPWGRRRGKSKADFFREEFLGLNPKAQGGI